MFCFYRRTSFITPNLSASHADTKDQTSSKSSFGCEVVQMNRGLLYSYPTMISSITSSSLAQPSPNTAIKDPFSRRQLSTNPSRRLLSINGQWSINFGEDDIYGQSKNTFGNILSNVDPHSYKLSLFLAEPESLSKETFCIIVDTEEAELDSDDFTPLIAEQLNMSEFLSVHEIRMV